MVRVKRVRVTGIPDDVQEILAADHPATSINDQVVGVLSQRYGIESKPSGLPSQRESIGPNVALKLPEDIWVAVKEEAVPYSTMSAVIIHSIREAAL
jgi:hypothetical protein